MSDGAVTARERELLSDLLRWADTLDELADMFRATAGDRPASLAYVYADVAQGVRRQVHHFERSVETAARRSSERETADHPG